MSRQDVRVTAPNRATHRYLQRLHASAERVFPLLCPVRECDWAVGWAPRLVVSASGLAERDCVFVTPEGDTEAVWYVTRHEPEQWVVEMLKITPGVTACRLEIRLQPQGPECRADVTYSHTSLGPEGDALVARFTANHYRRFMQQWEAELNHFLDTGRMLAAGP
jgi:hypothetical protein